PSAAEQPAEEVAEITEVEVAEVDVAEAAGAARPAVGRAERVVGLALLVVREHVVGGLDLLEPLLGLAVARIAVRAMLARELAVRLLDLVLRRVLWNAENLVKALVSSPRCHPSPSPRRSRPARGAGRGRRACSPSGSPRSRSPPRGPTAARAAPRGRAGRSVRSSGSPPAPVSSACARGHAARGGRPLRASPPRAPRRPRARARGRRRSEGGPARAPRWRALPGSPGHARSACGSCRTRPSGAGARRGTRRAPS